MGLLEALTLIFIVLKLTGYIDWSWFWVLSPTIFTVVLYVALLLGLVTSSSKKPKLRK